MPSTPGPQPGFQMVLGAGPGAWGSRGVQLSLSLLTLLLLAEALAPRDAVCHQA